MFKLCFAWQAQGLLAGVVHLKGVCKMPFARQAQGFRAL